MKNLLCFLLASISCLSIVIGQKPQEKIHPWLEKDIHQESRINHSLYTGMDKLPILAKNQNLPDGETRRWVWDTIITYDTTGPYERITQSFDIQGKVISQVTELWLANTWVNYEKVTPRSFSGTSIIELSSFKV